jgi:hypothetical protein
MMAVYLGLISVLIVIVYFLKKIDNDGYLFHMSVQGHVNHQYCFPPIVIETCLPKRFLYIVFIVL